MMMMMMKNRSENTGKVHLRDTFILEKLDGKFLATSRRDVITSREGTAVAIERDTVWTPATIRMLWIGVKFLAPASN